MEIKNDEIKISTLDFDGKGQRIEPEQHPAARVITGTIDAGLRGGQKVGDMPMQIIAETSAGEIARTMRAQCLRCKHFDNRNWIKVLRHKDGSEVKADREEINALRAALLQTMNVELADAHAGQDGDFDVEHALGSMGICRAMTEQAGEAVIVHPLSSCPDEVRSATQPDGLFEMRDDEAEKTGNAIYDEILMKATGRRP